VAYVQEVHGISQRRACSLLGAQWTLIRYRARRPYDVPVRARLHELAVERPRFGYRRLGILLRREVRPARRQVQRGRVSYYASRWHGQCMTNGCCFKQHSNSAIGRTLPLGTQAQA
jgi:rare lipoprotein A (peptidoglycan hydrolase)